MSDFVVEAEAREDTGRAAARRLRHAGRIPAIIYGGNKPELPITVNRIAVTKLLDQEAFYTSIVDIKIKGKRGANKALVKDVQWHPVRDEVMHIDFMRVSSSDVVHVTVPVHAVNFEKSPGDVKGGLLEIIRHELEVACRADAIPEAIEVDCANLDIGDTVHIRDLALPDGVTVPEIEHNPELNFTVLNVAAPRVESAAEEGAEEAGEAAPEETSSEES